MRHIDLEEQARRTDFAMEAAGYFSKHPEKKSYTSKDIEDGELFALRWGLGEDCVLVFTVADEPEIYAQVIHKEG